MSVMSHKFRYVGSDPALIGQTALGAWSDGWGPPVFKVWVDDPAHPWSHDWHETNRHDWRYTKEES